MVLFNIFEHVTTVNHCQPSQLRELFFQNRECIENFSWQFFGLRVGKRKERKAKTNRECIEKKSPQNVALRVKKFVFFSL